jgi:hypothetical protein
MDFCLLTDCKSLVMPRYDRSSADKSPLIAIMGKGWPGTIEHLDVFENDFPENIKMTVRTKNMDILFIMLLKTVNFYSTTRLCT